jgi:hypothetical protein
MIQDRPVYEEMARRGSRGVLPWLAGNLLVRAGIWGIILLLLAWPVTFYLRVSDFGLIFFLALVASAGVFTLGSLLKKLSYKIALREGIDVAGILQGKDDDKP